MTTHRVIVQRLALVTVTLGAACASSSQLSEDSGPPPQGAETSAMTIRVENDRPEASAIVVYLTPEVGVRRQLGEVDAGTANSFSYEGRPGIYRLTAIGRDGREIQSDSFRLFANGTAIWSMQTNRVSVAGR